MTATAKRLPVTEARLEAALMPGVKSGEKTVSDQASDTQNVARDVVLPNGVRPASASELKMRADVTAYLREKRPDAVILNELQVGGCRADLAMVEPQKITLFELKSERDKLDRAAEQMKAFRGHAHEAILVADAKFFDRAPYQDGRERCAWMHEGTNGCLVWHYPQPPKDVDLGAGGLYRWQFEYIRSHQTEPKATTFLHLLWRDEMIAEAKRHNIPFKSKMAMWDISRAMAWHMTGREICEAVCRQLANRGRWYERGDPQEAYQPISAGML